MEGCTSLDVPYTSQQVLCGGQESAPTFRCSFFQPTEAAGETSLPAEAPRWTSFERGLPERFAKPIRAEHQKWKVQHRGCFAKSRSWPDQPRPLFMSSKRASNNRPWAGLLNMPNHLEQTTRRGVTHDVEGRQSGAKAAQGVRPPLQTILVPLKVFTPAASHEKLPFLQCVRSQDTWEQLH